MKAGGSPTDTVQRQCRRVSANNMLTVITGLQARCHPLSVALHGVYACAWSSMRDFPRNDAESGRATMVAQAAPTQQATGRDACAQALGRSRWTMSVTAADGTFAVMGDVESGRHVCQPRWYGTAGNALKNRCICDVQGAVEPSHARLRFAWETEPYPVARGEVIPRMAWIYASGRDAERAEAANACRWALCSASFPGRVTPCA